MNKTNTFKYECKLCSNLLQYWESCQSELIQIFAK